MTGRRLLRLANRFVWIGSGFLVIALLAGLLTWAMLTLKEGSDHRDQQIDALVGEVHDISADAAQDHRSAAAERDVLQAKLDAALAGQDTLARLLRANGIPVPTTYVTTVQRRVIVRRPRIVHRARRHPSHHRRAVHRTPIRHHWSPGHRKHHR